MLRGCLTAKRRDRLGQYCDLLEVANPSVYSSHRGANPYCPNHATGVTLPADFVVTPLQYVD
jgi:hypothetical protein